MRYKRGTMLKQGKMTGFICDENNGNKLYPISVIWDGIENKVFQYDEKWLDNKHNNVEIIDREEYIRLINSK